MARDRANLQELGVFIREHRQQLGLTQTQLGRRIGYYQERISALERGTYGLPSLPAMEELAQALECELEDLLCACGYIQVRMAEPVESHGVPDRNVHLRDGVKLINEGMDVLQQRLIATESAVYEMMEIRHRMRATREAMNSGVRECLKTIS